MMSSCVGFREALPRFAVDNPVCSLNAWEYAAHPYLVLLYGRADVLIESSKSGRLCYDPSIP